MPQQQPDTERPMISVFVIFECVKSTDGWSPWTAIAAHSDDRLAGVEVRYLQADVDRSLAKFPNVTVEKRYCVRGANVEEDLPKYAT